MGYYSSIDFKVRILKDKIKECAKFVEERVQELSEGYVVWHLRNITEIDEHGNVKFDEHFCKWYHEVDFLYELLPYLDNGRVIFTGEDGDVWGYELSDGKLHGLSVEYRRAEEIRV